MAVLMGVDVIMNIKESSVVHDNLITIDYKNQ